MYSVDKTPSGIEVVTKYMPGMYSASLGVWINVGSRFESPDKAGISHFVEHMLFKGTKTRTAKDISIGVEGLGGSLNAFTAEEFTCYTVKLLGSKIHEGIEIISDMICNPLFDPAHIEQERRVICEEIRMYLDTPAQHVQELINTILWPDQPLGKPVIGCEDTVLGLTRKDILDFTGRAYVKENIVVAACGNVRHDQVMDTVEELVAPVGGSRLAFDPVMDTESADTVLYDKDTEQVHLCMAVKGFHRNHPDRFPLKLLSVILGENMSSHMFQEIREHLGLTYDIHSYLSFYKDSGSFVVTAGAEENKAVRIVEKVLEIFQKAGEGSLITEDDLARAKQYYLGMFAMSMEKTVSNMLWAGEYYLCTGSILSYEEIVDLVNRVTLDDLHRITLDIFDITKIKLAAVGPFGKKAVLERELKGLFSSNYSV